MKITHEWRLTSGLLSTRFVNPAGEWARKVKDEVQEQPNLNSFIYNPNEDNRIFFGGNKVSHRARLGPATRSRLHLSLLALGPAQVHG